MGRVPQRDPMRRGVRLRWGGVAAGKGPMTGGDTHSPAHPPPPASHTQQEGAWAAGGRDQDEGGTAPSLTGCVTLGKCLSFSVLRLVSYETGVTRVHASESHSRRY